MTTRRFGQLFIRRLPGFFGSYDPTPPSGPGIYDGALSAESVEESATLR